MTGESDPKCKEFEKTLHVRIAERAHRIFEQSGFEDGRDLANWLQAEAQLISEIRELTEAGSWVSARAPLPNAVPGAITVLVRRNLAIVCAEAWEIAADSPDTDARHRHDSDDGRDRDQRARQAGPRAAHAEHDPPSTSAVTVGRDLTMTTALLAVATACVPPTARTLPPVSGPLVRTHHPRTVGRGH